MLILQTTRFLIRNINKIKLTYHLHTNVSFEANFPYSLALEYT